MLKDGPNLNLEHEPRIVLKLREPKSVRTKATNKMDRAISNLIDAEYSRLVEAVCLIDVK